MLEVEDVLEVLEDEVVVIGSVVVFVLVNVVAGLDDVLVKNVYIISPVLTYITNAPLAGILFITSCPSILVSHIPNLLLDVNETI